MRKSQGEVSYKGKGEIRETEKIRNPCMNIGKNHQITSKNSL